MSRKMHSVLFYIVYFNSFYFFLSMLFKSPLLIYWFLLCSILRLFASCVFYLSLLFQFCCIPFCSAPFYSTFLIKSSPVFFLSPFCAVHLAERPLHAQPVNLLMDKAKGLTNHTNTHTHTRTHTQPWNAPCTLSQATGGSINTHGSVLELNRWLKIRALQRQQLNTFTIASTFNGWQLWTSKVSDIK